MRAPFPLFAIALALSSCASTPHASDSHRRGLFVMLSGPQAQVDDETVEPVKRHPAVENSDLPAARPVVAIDSSGRLGGRFYWPLQRISVTSPFGRRPRDFHEGIDLKADNGTPIFAAQSGQVIYAGSKIHGYGRMIVIKHRGGYATVYAHASRLLVRKGQRISAGQRIAFSGHTGRATGPHLHFEIRKGVGAVDPWSYLKLAGGPAATPQRKLASVRQKKWSDGNRQE